MSKNKSKIIRMIHIIVTLIVTCAVLWRLITGEFVPHLVLILLLLLVPFKFYNNHVVLKRQFEESGREKEYNRIVLKSTVQAIIIVTVLVVGTVLYVVYFK